VPGSTSSYPRRPVFAWRGHSLYRLTCWATATPAYDACYFGGGPPAPDMRSYAHADHDRHRPPARQPGLRQHLSTSHPGTPHAAILTAPASPTPRGQPSAYTPTDTASGRGRPGRGKRVVIQRRVPAHDARPRRSGECMPAEHVRCGGFWGGRCDGGRLPASAGDAATAGGLPATGTGGARATLRLARAARSCSRPCRVRLPCIPFRKEGGKWTNKKKQSYVSLNHVPSSILVLAVVDL